MEKWSKEKAKTWYASKPWIRGFGYYPSCCANRVEIWQEWGWQNVKECIDRELKLASEWGFNSVRLISHLEVWIDQHDSYMNHLEEMLQIAHKYGMSIMFTFGNDCVVQKQNYQWPTYGPQEFDFGYHSGKAKSPHVVMNEPGYNIIDEPEYEQAFYNYIKEVVGKYANDERIIIWDIYNEPGNSRRGMKSFNYLKNAFQMARSCNPVQPCTACCWQWDENHHPFREIEIAALEMSDIISYHNYENMESTVEAIKYLKEKYDRPLINTEWLHRIWHNTVEDMFPLYRRENVGCYNWGWVTGKTQTKEPWEWLFNVYDSGKGRDWDFTKWQHDLARANHRPYDFKEFDVIQRETKLADKEFLKRQQEK